MQSLASFGSHGGLTRRPRSRVPPCHRQGSRCHHAGRVGPPSQMPQFPRGGSRLFINPFIRPPDPYPLHLSLFLPYLLRLLISMCLLCIYYSCVYLLYPWR
jgi:hypothetical protein